MKTTNIYINGMACISPQESLDKSQFLEVAIEHTGNQLSCIEPKYKDFIPPMQARRMSRILKMCNVAAQISLKDAGVEKPDAIEIATGLGCMADSEKFLKSIIDNGEEMLTPTAFIQSTHNTIGGQLALALGVNNQNFTFSHNDLSFEHALLDSLMLIRENEARNVLLGGADEITENTHIIKEKLGLLKMNAGSNFDILTDETSGTIEGEGASFFVLSPDKANSCYGKLTDLSFGYKPTDMADLEKGIIKLLSKHNLKIEDLSLVISGYNGDQQNDEIFKTLGARLFKSTPQAYYKHLCGDYMTSSAFSLWLAARIMKEQKIPKIINLNEIGQGPINHIFIHNQASNNNHSFILLSKC
ncbi:MAG: beta-ketoacyl synthase chain length factor [Bacteroidales bacterium]|nr:beta-ketoacyl synthase chain length factor [Bacteroidales bacterium]MCF8458650.1 beta-ketoacyl synthase chain length factor [Bacteroidales bacterium]